MMEKKVVIIDYDMGNLYSVNQACQKVGINSVISSSKEDIESADAVILPGVGAYGNAMKRLEELDLIEPIVASALSGKPFLGICLGMQLMLTQSEEFGINKGLNIIEGNVKRFPDFKFENRYLKIPQIQWNKISKIDNPVLLNEVANQAYFYFLHSFYVEPTNEGVVTSTTEYCGINYCSSFQKGSIFGTQFHPEKSTSQGLTILKNFKNIIINGRE
jgi:glutamine amidotransferase